MSTMVATPTEMTPQPEIAPRIEVTPEELLRMPDGKHYELINGELVERKMSALSSVVASRVNRILGNHCEERNLGWVLDSEVGYQCFPWKPGRVRRADVSLITLERYSLAQLSQEGFVSIPPDLAVEVISPNDLVSELNEKLEDYQRAGVRVIWVIDPESRILDVYHPDGNSARLHEADEVTSEDVIPGFRCSVAVLFPAVPENPSAATTGAGS